MTRYFKIGSLFLMVMALFAHLEVQASSKENLGTPTSDLSKLSIEKIINNPTPFEDPQPQGFWLDVTLINSPPNSEISFVGLNGSSIIDFLSYRTRFNYHKVKVFISLEYFYFPNGVNGPAPFLLCSPKGTQYELQVPYYLAPTFKDISVKLFIFQMNLINGQTKGENKVLFNVENQEESLDFYSAPYSKVFRAYSFEKFDESMLRFQEPAIDLRDLQSLNVRIESNKVTYMGLTKN
jgi:hypothetical protein